MLVLLKIWIFRLVIGLVLLIKLAIYVKYGSILLRIYIYPNVLVYGNGC